VQRHHRGACAFRHPVVRIPRARSTIQLSTIANVSGPREKNRVAPSAIFFQKTKAILRHQEGERRFLSAAPWSVFLWNDPQARKRVKMGPSGAGKSGFRDTALAI
jgi:hypothetical protein